MTEYTKEKLKELSFLVRKTVQSDGLPIYTWARAAKVLLAELDRAKFRLDEWERIVGGTPAGDVFYDNVREYDDK